MKEKQDDFQIIIFGTGTFSEIVVQQLTEQVYMYLDNDKHKHGTQINGVNVYLPKVLAEGELPPYKIIIASSYYEEISIQLLKLGYKENEDFYNAQLLFIEEYRKGLTWSNEITLLKEKVKTLKLFPKKSLFFNYVERYKKLNPNDPRIKMIENNQTIKNLEDLSEIEIEKIYLGYYKQNIDIQSVDIVKKNVHFVFDNMASKAFYDYVKKQEYFNQNLFVLIESYTKFGFFTGASENIYRINYTYLNKYSSDYCLISTINQSENVFIHDLSNIICKFFENPLLHNKKTHWIVWGADLYSDIQIPLYYQKTKELINGNTLTDIQIDNLSKAKFIKNLDVILTGIKGDYNLVKENFETDAKHEYFFYPLFIDFEILDRVINDAGRKKTSNGINILVGNSGTATNNHLEVFEILAQYLDEINEVVVPLSYGDKEYIENITYHGRRLLGNKFKPLYEFLKKYEYAKIVNECDLIFMNHRRQQGFANMIVALYLGKMVYLSENVTTYGTLVDWKLNVKKIESFLYNPCKKLADYIDVDSYKKVDLSREIIKKSFEDIYGLYFKLFE